MKNFMRSITACLLVAGLALAVPVMLTVPDDVYAAPGGGGSGKEKGSNKCGNGVDDDGDTFIDCLDSDCDGTNHNGDPYSCEYATELSCNDGWDNDGDGLTDGADPDCQNTTTTSTSTTSTTSTSTTSTTTTTGVVTTSTSSTTTTSTVFVANLEICDNGLDDDGDGDIDCNDYADCVQAVNCNTGGQNAFNILMNYELGMHCTGFEFAYCCVLPPYNSILAQVVKSDKGDNDDWPRLLEADHNVGLDFLGRPTVLRDHELDANGNFKKYMLRYWHDAQPRNQDPNGKPQSTSLISVVEGNSLLMWNTVFDSAAVDAGNHLVETDGTEDASADCTSPTGAYRGTTTCDGTKGVFIGDGTYGQAEDNYANAWLNHFYIYEDLEGSNGSGTSAEISKIRLGLPNAHIPFSTVLPDNSGPAFHPLGPGAVAGLNNVLTFSGDTGTVVFTQMKVLENLPVMLTSPRIWEALGLPLTPFEDTIDFFGDPGLVDEDSIRPYVAMKAQLHEADCVGTDCTPGDAVLDDGHPVIGFGTAPIDIPNCERCHSDFSGVNAAQSATRNPGVMANVQLEINFWNAYYGIAGADSDWYSRLKGAAISIVQIHDQEHGTHFMDDYPGTGFGIPQNYRLGHESVVCQRCHGDNVIAVVKGGLCGPNSGSVSDPCDEDTLIPPLTEAIHQNHRSISEGGDIDFVDSQGRDGGCQGCHPAHRSDGSLASYPITEDGSNGFAGADNRDAAGGCFVGRDVHSNAMKDVDGVETPEHLNPVGQWLATNVFEDASPNGASGKGIWCTNCHQQFSQEMWRAENCADLIHAGVGDSDDCTTNVRNPAGGTLSDVISAVNSALGTSYTQQQVEDWLDPQDPAAGNRSSDQTHAVWNSDPGLCDYVASLAGAQPLNPAQDPNVAVVEVLIGGSLGGGGSCSNAGDANAYFVPVDCGFVTFDICGSTDTDGDFNVNLVGNSEPDAGPFGGAFCTTPDCVGSAQATLGSCTLAAGDKCAVPVPFSAATDARDHWLAGGEPHCADCHAPPYTEQSGNITFYPPFNYPRKASLNRYTRGHQDITCQGCHESIHGLYPVTPPGMYGPLATDTTSYAQAASHNADGSHGPLKCGTCHAVLANGVAANVDGNGQGTPLTYDGTPLDSDFDAAVSWMHTYTDEADPRDSICLRCHVDNRAFIDSENGKWTTHARSGRVSRDTMDKAEILQVGWVSGDPLHETPETTVCTSCHGNRVNTLERKGCTDRWKEHLIEGRANAEVWTYVTDNHVSGQPAADGTSCGW